MQPMRNRKCLHGFTLIELLLALSIFSLISLIAYQTLQITSENQSRSHNYMNELSRIDHMFFIMGKHLLQTVNRGISNHEDEQLAALTSVQNTQQSSIEFTHHGRVADIEPVFYTLQRSRYRLDKRSNTLLYETWDVLDQSPGSKPQSRQLADNITSLHFEFIDIAGKTHTRWPSINTTTGKPIKSLPTGIRITLRHDHLGQLQRYFPIAG